MNAAPRLAYITTCKGRLQHLRQSLPRIAGQPGIECIVVDYACPDGTTDWVRANFPAVTVVRVEGAAGFNVSHARNLGAQAATSPWLGFFDADVLLAPDFAATVVPTLAAGNFYRAQPVTLQTWGSIICQREDFARVRGYDEAYVGWGGEDDDLIALLRLAGRTERGFPAALLDEIPHGDDQRLRYFAVQDRWLQSRINQLYLQIKLDLMHLQGILPNEQLAAIFGEVSRTLRTAGAGNRAAPATVQITLPAARLGSPPINGLLELARLERTFTYSLAVEGVVPATGLPFAAPAEAAS